jgi:hypothetical protein
MNERDWIQRFFHYSVHRHKPFYWEWDQFLITMRVRGRRREERFYEAVIEISESLLHEQKTRVRIECIDAVPILMRLYDYYPSRMINPRNIQSSTHFLSFRSFLHLLLLQMIRLPPASITQPILTEPFIPIEGFLALHNILPIRQRQKTHCVIHTLPQLITLIG